ncbi:hypothetical protein FEE96_19595 [Parasedimentitalea maritima]|uniref:Uncharacterized protein n=2 Tax=Parasedimentitalea TaxID=2738399 RepID=A0A6L6WGR3_9RHOB|nr:MULTISPECIES: hypothetical protein [Zongyanglinia]KAE9627616.1 hypothetical protein GP644_18725 [Zongyanglinia marina]MVO16976.1 hypothetical protein [Zongyanglinia huanghaiensis]TLP57583.1 hypothetical protein FEE96_19595 [Zongyanglinia marina]
MQAGKITLVFGLCAGLAACGSTTGEQVAIGAGAGALGSVLLNTNPLTGAAVGVASNLIYCNTKTRNC